MKILVLSSDKAEFKGLTDRFICRPVGVGLCMAAVNSTIAILEEKPDLVINIGSSGAGAGHEIGEVLEIGEVSTFDQDLSLYRLSPGATLDERRSTISSLRLRSTSSYRALSSSRFACQLDSSGRFDVYDMELYSVALAGAKTGVPVSSFKLVTDIVGESVRISDYSERLRRMRSLLLEKVEAYLDALT